MPGAYAPLLARIDDRLIHGQVVVGCCEPLGAKRILLVDDAVAHDPLQQKLYRAGVPPKVSVEFASVAAAPTVLEALGAPGSIGDLVVVVSRARIMDRLQQAGVRFECVQIGGAHAREDADELVDGIFLDREDRDALRALLRQGTRVVIQPVAQSAVVTVDDTMLAGAGS
jgi:mannose/fructose/N-acetylgalactosamine-specific phosphotransferase system component IIB